MTPFDHYRQIRDQQMEGGLGLALPRHPFVNIYQPLQALRALIALPNLQFAKGLVPNQTESGEAPLSDAACWPSGRFPNLAVSSQLALLWAALAKRLNDDHLTCAANRLVGFLYPILSERLTSLWTLEKQYSEEEITVSSALLFRSIGKPFNTECLDFLKKEENFFSSLYRSDLQLELEKEVKIDKELGYALFRKEDSAWAFTTKGWQMSAGAMRFADVEIPAFGPHLAPLSDPLLFGIGPGDKQWFSSFASKESWFCIESIPTDRNEASFILHSTGISIDKPLSFVFYFRADECKIGNRVYKPKSLHRYCDHTQEIQFETVKNRVMLSIERPLKVEVIPLAGGTGFWGATFLAAIWLPPFHSKTHFRIALNP